MPTNNKSIHILRGRTSSTSEPNAVDNTPLEAGQPFYDKRTNTLRIGDGTNAIKNVEPVTVADGAVTTTKLHDASNDESNRTGITTAKIENSAITGLKIADGSISDSKVAPDADISGSKFKDNSISGSKLHDADGSSGITTGKIEDNAVTTTKIKDRSITGDKLVEDFVFEQLGGQYTFTLSDGQSSEPTLEFADLHPSSNARVFLLADLEGKKDYQARLMLPTIANTEENTLATKEQIESGDIVAKEAVTAQTTGFTKAIWYFASSEVEVRDSALYEILVDNLFIVVGGGTSFTNRGRAFNIVTKNSNGSTIVQYFDVYDATISSIEYTSYLTVSKTRYEVKNLDGYIYWVLDTRTQITDFRYRRIA